MRTVSLLSVLLLLAGCGADPTGVADDDLLPPVREEIGFPSKPYAGPDLAAVELLGGLKRWQQGLKGAAYTARVYARGSAGEKPAGLPWAGGGEWEARTTWEVQYAKPAAYRYEAEEATERSTVGTRLLFDERGAQLKFPGLAGWVTRSRPLAHADLADCRGQSLPALTLGATVQRVGAAAAARIVGEGRLDGAVLDLIEVPASLAGDPEIAREVLGLERGSHALRLHQRFAADGRKVYEHQLLALRPQAWKKLAF